jgi:hypothetical protein
MINKRYTFVAHDNPFTSFNSNNCKPSNNPINHHNLNYSTCML